MIAAKAKAEWENQVRGFESLQMENEKLQLKLKEKEMEFERHKAWMDGSTDKVVVKGRFRSTYIHIA